jgi:hypothetical protein
MRLLVHVVMISAMLVPLACTKKSKSDGKDSGGGAQDSGQTDADGGVDADVDAGDDKLSDEEKLSNIGQIALGDNPLAIAYPEGLAVAVVPDVVPADVPSELPQRAGTVALTTSLALQDAGSPQGAALVDKVVAAGERLAGEGECFDPQLFQSPPGALPNCYDPDKDLNFHKDGSNPPQSVPRPTVTGTGEACMVGYARSKMLGTIEIVDRSTGLLVAMLCQAKKSGLADAFPAVGAKLNLKEQVSTALAGVSNVTVVSASVERLADATANMLFASEITIEQDLGGGNVRRESINLLHAPSLTSANESHHGRLWVQTGARNDPTAAFIQINYQRSGTAADPLLNFELVKADFAADTGTDTPNDAKVGTPFDANGVLDLNHGADFTKPTNDPLYGHWDGDTTSGNGLNNTMVGSVYIAFAMNPLTSAGKLMYWQNFGGNYQEAARGMVFNLAEASDRRLKGCSVSGAALSDSPGGHWSIRNAQKSGSFAGLTPTGYYHPQGTDVLPAENRATDPDCLEGLCQFAPFAYRQCFVQGTDGKYDLDEDNMTSADGYDILPKANAQVTAIELPSVAGIPAVSR